LIPRIQINNVDERESAAASPRVVRAAHKTRCMAKDRDRSSRFRFIAEKPRNQRIELSRNTGSRGNTRILPKYTLSSPLHYFTLQNR